MQNLSICLCVCSCWTTPYPIDLRPGRDISDGNFSSQFLRWVVLQKISGHSSIYLAQPMLVTRCRSRTLLSTSSILLNSNSSHVCLVVFFSRLFSPHAPTPNTGLTCLMRNQKGIWMVGWTSSTGRIHLWTCKRWWPICCIFSECEAHLSCIYMWLYDRESVSDNLCLWHLPPRPSPAASPFLQF